MKTIKIKNATYKIMKWIQSQDLLLGENDTIADTIIFKGLCHYATQRKMNLKAILEVLENDDDK